ncbi:cysteate synthase [Micromonospora sp. CPCC 205371]|nr:cysteate synthase [Micromonospora sp. CPCC 205371]
MTDGRHYALVCPLCNRRQVDDGVTLNCPEGHAPALLRTEYTARAFTPIEDAAGLSRYRNWLPVRRALPSLASAVFHSEGFGPAIGLSQLWIAFHGYWPERGADLESGTFKDFEAATVAGRLPEGVGCLVVASAGNTASAFAALCSRLRLPALILVPDTGMAHLRLRRPPAPCLRIVVVDGGGYGDCIELAARIARRPGFQAEGGVHNVGRRDGLATVMLSAYEAMGRLPAYYFQAVGSGVGAIAAHEAATRLLAAGAGPAFPRLMLGQNSTYSPIYDAWRAAPRPGTADLDTVRAAYASELANPRPPFSPRGGVRECLVESGGDVLVADARDAEEAGRRFRDSEGVDIAPAAAVAAACLRLAGAAGRIPPDAPVVLNITAGGRQRLAREHQLVEPAPALRVDRGEAHSESTLDAIGDLFAASPAVA